MKNLVLLSEKKRHLTLFSRLSGSVKANWYHIAERTDLTAARLEEIKPDYVFIPHWSYILPADIYERFPCIVFHMTDLPYGRGGSPLQNLIVRGHKTTMVSALKVTRGLDAGPVYLKKPLDLGGTASEIFERADVVIHEMILEILEKEPLPLPQEGEIVVFERRKPEQSNISGLENIGEIYDYIRMLDAEGYPNAFLETEHFKIEFTNAKPIATKSLTAHVNIIPKQKDHDSGGSS